MYDNFPNGQRLFACANNFIYIRHCRKENLFTFVYYKYKKRIHTTYMKRLFHSLALATMLMASFSAHAFEAGQTVRLTINGRTASVKNSALTANEIVQVWTETNTNSQRWTLEANGEKFYLKNVYGGYYLGATGTVGANGPIGQVAKNASKAAWNLTPVEGKKNVYTLSLGTGTYSLAAPTESSDGGALVLLKTSTADAARIEWTIEETTPMSNELDEAKRDDMMKKWCDHYYHKASTGYVIGKGGWWGDAEMFEVVIDAYETTGDRQYLTMFDNLYKNFCQRNNTDWSGNNFNDDIAWMCIACVRAYLLSGNTDYRDKAKANWDKMYARADKYGDGTLIWCQNWEGNGPAGTNSCINGPAAVCACYLGIATGTESYFTKAKKIYAGEREKLMEKNSNGTLTGKVFDSYSQKDKKVSNTWASSYNQGTNLGAAMMLYNHYGDEQYKKDADAIMTWTYNNMKNSQGILTACQNVTGDLAGFKAILMRYVRRYAAEHNTPKYYDWMRVTAYHAWNNRNSKGVTSGGWLTKTEEDFKRGSDSYDTDGVGAMGCISAAFNGHLGVVDIHNGYEKMEAEHFNFIQGSDIQAGDDEDGTRVASKMRNKYQTGYRLVKFGDKSASHITLRARMLRSTSKITFYADQPSATKGTLLCAFSASDFAELNQWESVTKELSFPIDGEHDIYMVCTGTANYDLADVNWFQFDSRYTMYPDMTNLGGQFTTTMTGATDFSALTDGKATTDVRLTLNAEGENSIVYDAQKDITLTAYSLWSGLTANTQPTSYVLEGSANGQDFETIDDVPEAGFTTCGQCITRNVTTTKPYRYFRLNVRSATDTKLLTLSELQFIGSGLSMLDITADGGQTTEGMEALTDHNAATTLAIPATVAYASQGYYTLQGYGITGAQKGQILNWTLEGSDNGSSWKTIDKHDDFEVPFTGTLGFRVEAPAPYSQYRIRFTSGEATLSAWQLFGALDFGTFYADAAEVCQTTSAQALSDNDGTTYCDLSGDLSVRYYSPVPLKLVGYSLVPADDPALDPKDMVITGIDTEEESKNLELVNRTLAFPVRGKRVSNSASSTNTYNQLMVQFNKQATDAQRMRLAELELYATAIVEQEDEVFVKPTTVTTTSEGTSTTYSIAKLNDQSRTTHYQTAFTAPVSVTLTYDAPQTFDAYAITAAKNTAAADPAAWTLEGSSDGKTWTVLDRREDQTFSHRYATQFYGLPEGSNAYPQYRLTVNAVNEGTQLQIGELQLLKLAAAPTSVETMKGTEATMLLMAGALNINTPQATTVRFYDVQGHLLAVQAVGAGQSIVALPQHKGILVAAMNVAGKQVVRKISVQ